LEAEGRLRVLPRKGRSMLLNPDQRPARVLRDKKLAWNPQVTVQRVGT